MEPGQLTEALIEELSLITGCHIDADTDLLNDAGLDSFGTVQLIAFLEDSYGIEVSEDMLATEHFASVNEIAAWALPMIKTKVAAR